MKWLLILIAGIPALCGSCPAQTPALKTTLFPPLKPALSSLYQQFPDRKDPLLIQRNLVSEFPNMPGVQNMEMPRQPFFCRQEWKFEKRTGLPLRFRMGSVAATEWLEQKPNAQVPK